MRLKKLIESVLDERTIKSAAADQAKALGLVYSGYSRWEDPKNPGVTVAQTIDGQLVKVDPNAPKEPKAQKAAASSAPSASKEKYPTPSMADVDNSNKNWNGNDGDTDGTHDYNAVARQEPDSYTQTEPEDDMESVPQEDNAVDRLVNAANGDYLKVRKALVKKLRAGNEHAAELLKRVDAHEATQQSQVDKALAAVEARKNAQLAARKEKYASKYPSPQI